MAKNSSWDQYLLERNIQMRENDLTDLLQDLSDIPEGDCRIVFPDRYVDKKFYIDYINFNDKPSNENNQFQINPNTRKHFPKKTNHIPFTKSVLPQYKFGLEEGEKCILRGLGIGPEFQYKTDLTILLQKFKEMCICLSHLSSERFTIDGELFFFNCTESLLGNETRLIYVLEKPDADSLSHYFEHAILSAANEYYLFKDLMNRLIIICKNKDINCYDSCEQSIIKDYQENFEYLREIREVYLRSSNNQFNSSKNSEEFKLIMSAVDGMIALIKCSHTYIWILKENIKMNTIKANIQRDRDNNIGS